LIHFIYVSAGLRVTLGVTLSVVVLVLGLLHTTWEATHHAALSATLPTTLRAASEGLYHLHEILELHSALPTGIVPRVEARRRIELAGLRVKEIVPLVKRRRPTAWRGSSAWRGRGPATWRSSETTWGRRRSTTRRGRSL